MRKFSRWPVGRCVIAAVLFFAASAGAEQLFKVGSNSSTESHVLAEIISQTAAKGDSGVAATVVHSGDLFDSVLALIEGKIDVYPIGVDRLAREIVVIDLPVDLESVNQKLAAQGLGVAVPLGFKRTYSIAVTEALARELKSKNVSELLAKQKLRYGFSSGFMADRGGYALMAKQGILPKTVSVKEVNSHDRDAALKARKIDVIDVFPTDPVIQKFHLTMLEDDKGIFASHDVVLLHRLDLKQRAPKIWQRLQGLENAFTAIALLDMNARVESDGTKIQDVAGQWVGARPALPKSLKRITSVRKPVASEPPNDDEPRLTSSLLQMTKRHIVLVCAGLFFSMLIGIPLGILANLRPGLGKVIIGGTKLIGITPFLALLVFCVALTKEFGPLPAIAALFLYGLWPIAAYTYMGLRTVPSELIDAATMQSLSGRDRFQLLDLPMAMGAIGKGIQRCAVVNVGTATAAAFIGSGGYGQAILQGLSKQDVGLMLRGAIPATLLAVAISLLFDWVARVITPIGIEPPVLPEG